MKNIDKWGNVKPYTEVQVRDSKWDEWKNAYFLRRKSNGAFLTTVCSEFSHKGLEGFFEEPYNYCRLAVEK
ncbi:MAG: hypothetical protein ACRCVJ_18835 [Clostridium sp.]|uniref:hypothetical protein n=1 Tax=Clostridium sp. TaxID=1506 RepID=UPI003F30DD9E